ncbi:MAG: ferritin family protein, partial [Candidatus Woesearchaeota archaeon]
MSEEILKWIRFAIDLEQKGLEFYTDCRKKSTHPRAIELFDFLVKAEKGHKEVLTTLLEAYSKGDKDKMKKSVKDFMDIHIDIPIFTKVDRKQFKEHDREISKALNIAMEMEDKAKDLYLDLAKKEPNPELKRLFEKI